MPTNTQTGDKITAVQGWSALKTILAHYIPQELARCVQTRNAIRQLRKGIH